MFSLDPKHTDVSVSGSLLAQQFSLHQWFFLFFFLPCSPGVHVGCSRSITSKLTWVLMQLLIQVCYRTVEQFLSYVQHIRRGSISKQLNYYSQSKKNLLLNQSIQRRNIRQLLLKTANFFVLERTIILFSFFFF